MTPPHVDFTSVTHSLRLLPLLFILTSITSVQFGGGFAAQLIPAVGASTTVLMRLGLAAIVLLAVARPRLRGHSARAWWSVIGLGCALGLMNWTFYGSLNHLPLGVAVTIEFLGPLGLAAALSRSVRDAAAVAFAMVGVVLISRIGTTPLDDLPFLGFALAGTAGLFWALYILASARVGADFPGIQGLAIAMCIATIITLPVGVSGLTQLTPHHWMIGGLIALLSSLIPYSLELVALRSVPKHVFGVLMSVEPAVAALAGFLIASQVLHLWQLVGMGCVIAASVIVTLPRKKPRPLD